MKKLFVVLSAFLVLAVLNVSAETLRRTKTTFPEKGRLERVEIKFSPAEQEFVNYLTDVSKILEKDLPRNEGGYYDRQELYFFHQNLLFRVEERNRAFLKLPKDSKLASIVAQLSFKSPVLGSVTLLNVIERLENFDWNDMGNVTVEAQELKAFLQKVPRK